MRYYLFLAFLVVLLSVLACQKKEDTQPIPKVPIQQSSPSSDTSKETQMPKMSDNPMMNPHGNIKKTEKKVEVPDSVKKKWSRVVIVVEDRVSNKKTEHTVNIGSDLKISGTKLTLKTGEFLPDFKMTETTITTASAELNNPALKVEVSEDGNIIFKGWLYQKFPEIHPFEHERYSIRLKNALP